MNGGGSIAGNILDNAALVFNITGIQSFAGVISGSGGLTQMGAGTLILTASNPFSGGTTITNGGLTLANANALPNSTATVNGNNGLLFASSGGTITTFNVGGLSGSGNISLADGSASALQRRRQWCQHNLRGRA